MLPAAPPTVIDMTRELVRIPSRAGVDSFVPIVDGLKGWLAKLGLPCRVVQDASGCPIAVVSWVPEPSGDTGDGARRVHVLSATFDTAGFGDGSAWSHAPLGAEVVDGWLYGRGSGDSKAGIAIFAHVAATLAAEVAAFGSGSATEPTGRLVLLFDGDEHAGSFTGARAFFEGPDRPGSVEGVMIGYPGNERLVVGSRGFLRVRLMVHGLAAHSGSASHRGINAIGKAGLLVERLAVPLEPAEPDFALPPQVTVTSIAGGEGFSSVPDRCELGVDVRLTPRFDRDAAQRWLGDVVGSVDAAGAPTEIIPVGSQPAFRVSASEPFVAALRTAGEEVFGRSIPTAIVGPSSIANYLATLGIPATAGFGVTAQGVHAPDERVELASFEPVYQTYLRTMRAVVGQPHRGAAASGA